jgi:hypothetical protein
MTTFCLVVFIKKWWWLGGFKCSRHASEKEDVISRRQSNVLITLRRLVRRVKGLCYIIIYT